jgi:signal peptidase II
MDAARSRRWLWLALGILVADRATKYAIEHFTPEGFRLALVPHVLSIVHSFNPGVAFGLLTDSASTEVSVALIAVSAAVVGLLVWLLAAGRAGDARSQVGIALIAGGAAGNLLDRILHGGVTDFVELRIGRFEWPAFNLADSAITIGALLVAYELLRAEHSASRRPR